MTTPSVGKSENVEPAPKEYKGVPKENKPGQYGGRIVSKEPENELKEITEKKLIHQM